MRTPFAIILLALAACAHNPKRLPPERSAVTPETPPQAASQATPSCLATKPTHAQRIAEHGSVLDLYHRQDGVWLPHAPVLVNEEFDFTLAMSMEDGLGAGLAAAKRKENNRKRAQELAELQFGDVVSGKLEKLCACGRDVYFVFWGREGKIKVVLDGEGTPAVVDGEGIEDAVAIDDRVETLLGAPEVSCPAERARM